MKVSEILKEAEAKKVELKPRRFYVVAGYKDGTATLIGTKAGYSSGDKAEEMQDSARNSTHDHLYNDKNLDDIFFADADQLVKDYPKAFSLGADSGSRKRKLKKALYYVSLEYKPYYESREKVIVFGGTKPFTYKTEALAKEALAMCKDPKNEVISNFYPGAKASGFGMGTGEELATKFPDYFIAE